MSRRKSLAPCSVKGCPTLSRQNRCDAHRKAAEAKRGSSAERGYGTDWRKVRTIYLTRFPYCQDKAGCINPATDVHHIHGEGPRGDNSDESLQALCHSHHSKQTAQHQPGGFVRSE